MRFIAVFLCVFIVGCAATREMETPTEAVEAVSLAPLPPLPVHHSIAGLTMYVMFNVAFDGTVLDAKLTKSSGEAGWDSLAVKAMKQWRFAPIHSDSMRGAHWLRVRVVVKVQEPLVLTLGELVRGTQREADSVYSLLKAGVDFDSLAWQARGISPQEYRRTPGAIEISRYPKHVRVELEKLRVNSITRPLRLGDKYLIYKRFPDRMMQSLPE